MQLSTLGRRTVNFDVAAAGFTPETVEIALLPSGTRPTTATEWLPVPKVDGAWKRVLAGEGAETVDAAIVVTETSDTFARLISGDDVIVVAVRNGRVNLI